MLKYFALAALGAAIVAPAFAQQGAAPAPQAQGPAAAPGAGGAPEGAQGRGGGRGRGGGAQAGEGGQAPGQGRGGPGGGRGPGGRGPNGQQPQTQANITTPTFDTSMPTVTAPPPQVIPPGPHLPGTIITAPSGFFAGMNVTNGTGDLLARVLSADGGNVLVQTFVGKSHFVPADQLKIDHATAVTKLTDGEIRAMPGPVKIKESAKKSA